MEVTIGGDRVGSGKKMKAHLHNYNRSTHNLSETFASSMGCGILYPALCKVGMRGDSFNIAINADCRTIPTVGPLFGSYKMQVDVYQIPVRLYQGILHNNPLAIGLKMSQVKFPIMQITSNIGDSSHDRESFKMNESSLLHYLGLSGLGMINGVGSQITRNINAIPALAYYDIFKTYYANKQEENAYLITSSREEVECGVISQTYKVYENGTLKGTATTNDNIVLDATFNIVSLEFYVKNLDLLIKRQASMLYGILVDLNITDNISQTFTLADFLTNDYPNDKILSVSQKKDILDDSTTYFKVTFRGHMYGSEQEICLNEVTQDLNKDNELSLKSFKLSNIDDMRYDLLSHHTLGTAFVIKNDQNVYYPYKSLVETGEGYKTKNIHPLNGLVIKTYQNDIYNNWLNTEWIEGENSISEMTKVAIVDGAFSMDALNFAQKQYNMLNRIAVAGATYEDWQDVVYEEVKRRQIESPIFVGGMSQEVVFDEIIQNAPANIDGEKSVLGELGGRGKLAGNKKGGKIHIKCDEACFIMAIVSLTPRLYYTQGNEFYMTDLFSMDDLHKPAMDGIGFQDLIGERLAWWDTKITHDSATVEHRSKIGKLPAWIEYMTSVNKAHGDFANENAGYMILSRRYEYDKSTRGIKDVTTYIDPTKFNYAFAYTDLDAQNFWVQIGFDIEARRLMSARLIPNV